MENNKKVYQIIAQRMAVQVLNNCMPMLSEEEDGITEDEIQLISKEYLAIAERLRKNAV